MRDRDILQSFIPLITLFVSPFTEFLDSRTVNAIVEAICSSQKPYVGFGVLAAETIACALFSPQMAFREICLDKAGDLSP